jgi:hypothetical protein
LLFILHRVRYSWFVMFPDSRRTKKGDEEKGIFWNCNLETLFVELLRCEKCERKKTNRPERS